MDIEITFGNALNSFFFNFTRNQQNYSIIHLGTSRLISFSASLAIQPAKFH